MNIEEWQKDNEAFLIKIGQVVPPTIKPSLTTKDEE
jgi:hypothetical protein